MLNSCRSDPMKVHYERGWGFDSLKCWKRVVDLLKSHELSQVANVASSPCPPRTFFVVQLVRVGNRYHMFMEAFGLSFLRAKKADSV